MKQYILSQHPFEACGIVKGEQFIALENVATENKQNAFRLPADTFSKYSNIQAIVHSHIVDSTFRGYDGREPTKADLVGQEISGVPWGICKTDGEDVSDLVWFGLPLQDRDPLIGRAFMWNVHDCFTLARDYLEQTTGVVLKIPYREFYWMELGETPITHYKYELGFTDIPINDLRVGDWLLMGIQSRADEINHIAVYLGDNTILHHLSGRLSRKDDFVRWRKFVQQVIRPPIQVANTGPK